MKSESGDNALKLAETPEGVVFSVHVQPRASRNEICGLQGGEIKVRLTAPPVEDAANRLCVEFFSKLLGVAKSKVSIVSGTKSRHKTLTVIGIRVNEFISLMPESVRDSRTDPEQQAGNR